MPDEFRLALDAESVEFKAYARQFENRGEEDEPARRAVLYVIGTMTFPDSGWRVRLEPVEGSEDEEWVLLEDVPGYRDMNRTYLIACGTSERELEAVPETIVVRFGDETKRVSVAPWD